MTRLAGILWDFWTRPVRAERLAVFRMAVGALVALDTALTLWPDAGEFFGPRGLFPAELYRLQSSAGATWNLIPPDASVSVIHLFLAGLIGSALCVALGLATRATSIIMWVLLFSVQQKNPYILTGGDMVLATAAFFLVLMPSGRAWSIDQRRRRGPPPSMWVPAWPLRLVQIQLAMIYFSTGLSKLPVSGGPGVGQWVSGHAIASALATPTVARFEWLTTISWWVWAPLTWATLVWELTFPALIMFRYTRGATLAFGITLHLGIFATLAVSNFSFAILCYYLVFLPTAWLVTVEPAVEGNRK